MTRKRLLAVAAATLTLLVAITAAAANGDPAQAEYRTFFGMSPRNAVWFIAELHLLFGAFVLGVPIFAVIIEYTGSRAKDPIRAAKFDRLALECTRLLAAAFSTTAALGGLMSFALFSMYPAVMQHLSGAMHSSFFLYGLLFFGEAFTMYLYYYSWKRMRTTEPVWPRLAKLLRWPVIALALVVVPLSCYLWLYNGEAAMDGAATPGPLYQLFWPLGIGFMALYGLQAWSAGRKSFHIFLGVLLNCAGIALMLIANSWASYMMSPAGVDPETGQFIGTAWQAISNPLWRPLSMHRLLGNIAFGGFIIGAYGAVKFLMARTQEQRAHYDWMGYIGNFIGVVGMLTLPFAGYYFGREVYSVNPVMGNDMMGGVFSWSFILQAVLIGVLFVGANFYLWAGMDRIDGADRYSWVVKFILAGLVLSFLVWMTPRSLPLAPDEAALLGGQFHPLIKYLGLMPAKNAAVNFILLSTFFSFMVYRRANKGELQAFSRQGGKGKVVLPIVAALTVAMVGWYAYSVFTMDPVADLGLDAAAMGAGERAATVRGVLHFHGWLLVLQIGFQIAAVILTFKDRGKLGQGLLLGSTAIIVSFVMGVSGYVVLRDANPFLRNMAVCQFLMVLSCMGLTTAIDLCLFRGAREVGAIRWGEIGRLPQYTLLLLALSIVLTMGLMGYVRAGLRGQWHVTGVLKDTSEWAATPTMQQMGVMVGAITATFLVLLTFVFWLGTFSHSDEHEPAASDSNEDSK